MAKRKVKEVLPTLDQILMHMRDAEQYWGYLHAEQAIDHTMFQLKQLVAVPEGYNVVRPATANTIINTAADHIAGDSPQVEVPEAGLSKAAQDRSEALEHGFQDALWRTQSAYVENFIRSLVVTGLWSGQMICQGPIFDGAEWGMIPIAGDYSDPAEYEEEQNEYETNKRTAWPFFTRALDPRNVYPDPGTVGRKWVIVRYQRAAGSIKQQWPSWDMRLPGMSKSDPPIQDGVLVNFMEYWDEKCRAYLVASAGIGGLTGTGAGFTGTGTGAGSGMFLDGPRAHRYGKPPFQIRSCGYGEDTGLPHERFRSILYPARSLINQEIAAISQLDAMMRRTAWSVVLTPMGSGFDSIEPGTVKEMEAGSIAETKTFSEINPGIIQSLMQELEFLSQQIQEATFPNVVSGMKAKGIASGYGQNSLVAQAKVKYGAAVVNLSSLLGEWCVDFGRCVQYVVGESVPIFGQTRWGMADSTLTPDQIGDLRKVVVTVNPKLPTDAANDLAMAQVALALQLIDKDTAITDFLHYEQPGEMRTRILRDKIMDSPEFQRVMVLATALKTGHIQEVLDSAKQIGMDPGQLLTMLGFGNPQQQTPGQQTPGQPNNVAAQIAPPGQSPAFGGNVKPQPTPGSQSDVRNQAAPGVPIG